MPARTYIANLGEGDNVATILLLRSKRIRVSRDGESYLLVELSDRTATIEGRAWVDFEALQSRADVDDFVAIRGTVVRFGDRTSIEITDLARADETDVDLTDFLPSGVWDSAALLAQLRDLLDQHVTNEAVGTFLDTLLSDGERVDAFCTAPAAMSNHHAYLGGLIEHCLSMCRLAVQIAGHYEDYYPGLINADLLVAGVILHDFAKVHELSYRTRFDYTTRGRLVGHIPMGAQLVREVGEQAGTPDDLIMHLEHLVLAHHGKQEYGSPVAPATPEALLLHQIDMIDSRMNMVATLRESSPDEGAEHWSDFRRWASGRILFRGNDSRTWEPRRSRSRAALVGPGLRTEGES